MKKSSSARQASDLPEDLSNPARRALAAHGVRRLSDLKRRSAAEVSAWRGIGPTAIQKLRRALKARGLAFGPKK